ncbi:MAG: hypothetical protein IIW63_07085 [Clostridia bacterium]|nr:hypothetical protein [Clostridia bacterium]
MNERNESSVEDILKRLHNATAENDSARHIPMPSGNYKNIPGETTLLEKTKSVDGNIPTRTETEDIIDKYSSRVKIQDSKSSTQGLRDALAARMEDDAELKNYYYGNKDKPMKSRRADELFALLERATVDTLGQAERKPAEIDTSRFMDPETVEKPVEYKQEELFPMGDTMPPQEDERETAVFDDEYAELSEKVVSGKIGLDEENDSAQLSLVSDDTDEISDSPFVDEDDIELKLALGQLDLESDDIPDYIREKYKKAEKDADKEDGEYEYTDRAQNNEVNRLMKRGIRHAFRRLAVAILFMLGIIYLELATKNGAGYSIYLSQGRYGVLYILADLQLLFFLGITLMPSLAKGAKGLFTFNLTSESIFFFSFVAASAYSLVRLFMSPADPDLRLFNLTPAVCGVCSAFINYLTAKKDYACFKVIASARSKYAASRVSGASKESDEFYSYLLEDSDIYTVKKTKFVSGFFARLNKRPKSEDLFNFLLPLVIIAAIAVFGVKAVTGATVTDALNGAMFTLSVSLPLSAFFIIAMPLCTANRRVNRSSSCFIGPAVAEEYADASVVSFADTEVYPPHLVKITSFRTYGDFRIDRVLIELSKIFNYVGGPLEKVLSSTITEPVEPAQYIRVLESASDGLRVVLDGKEYFIGKRAYMRRYRFEAPKDEIDDMYENSVGSVMFVSVGDRLAVKLYVKYSINPLFDELLRDMNKSGLCVGIKTLDPNINNELLANGIKYKKCPIAILKAGNPEDMTKVAKEIDSGIVTNSGLHNFLRVFALCDKTRHIIKSNGMICVIGTLLSIVAACFIIFSGDTSSIPSLYTTLFQFAWVLPVWLLSMIL